ncbi:4-methyl-5(b-hydroxyethyl)-thiazole monophosphate biosynthesis [Xenorhabdus koppenhoeferi]|uniref:4-methyl-5(B-hydroxyethyl)-thiazole monophosphate biosynthesis n=1 Tax=Xenorhabdus koppenhoeferi TaxID=351659 RepID=A0A1I7FIR6_9GAMM|nr:4-methyl-5(b-hydroxyethyl)-thiazole monophosphate biosynthesis [Xenorhabdus koppenhoeferi]
MSVSALICLAHGSEETLLTSQGPATAFDFALKLINFLKGNDKSAEVAAQLILPPGVNNYQNLQ